MTTTIGEIVSRIKLSLKAQLEDSFMTDRYVWSVTLKYARTYIKVQNSLDKLSRFKNLYKKIPCLELIEVDKIEACCNGIKSNCTIMRSKYPLPKPFVGPSGLLIRNLSSLDGFAQIYVTEPHLYIAMTKSPNFKYNKNKYYWYLNNHLYFPNIEWPEIALEGVWEDDINFLNPEDQKCISKQEMECNIPEDLFSEIELQIRNEIASLLQIPQDGSDDKQQIYR